MKSLIAISFSLAVLFSFICYSFAVETSQGRAISVRIMSGTNLTNKRIDLQSENYMAVLDKKRINTNQNIRLEFGDNLKLESGGATLNGEVLALYPENKQSQVRLTMPDGKERFYPGRIRLEKQGGHWVVINDVPLETYVAAVAQAETGLSDPLMLKLMTIVVRSIAAQPQMAHKGLFFDTTRSMMYRGSPGPLAIESARQTKGKVLVYSGSLFPVFFHSVCGGKTRPANEVFPKATTIPPLLGVKDLNDEGTPWCSNSKFFTWQREISREKFDPVLAEFLRQRFGEKHEGTAVIIKKPGDLSPLFILTNKGRVKLPVEAFRLFIGKRLGWNLILTDRFSIQYSGNDVHFQGKGFGHRAGLCMAGAKAQLQAGRSIRDVLQFYFPGSEILDFHKLK